MTHTTRSPPASSAAVCGAWRSGRTRRPTAGQQSAERRSDIGPPRLSAHDVDTVAARGSRTPARSPRSGSRSGPRQPLDCSFGRALKPSRKGEAPPSAPSSAAVPTQPAAPCTSTVSPRFAIAKRWTTWWRSCKEERRLRPPLGRGPRPPRAASPPSTKRGLRRRPLRQRADAVSLAQPQHPPEFLHDADELVAGREQWLRRALDVRPRGYDMGQRHPGRRAP